MEAKIWKHIEGWEKYSISSHGTVRSNFTGKTSRIKLNRNGDMQVILYFRDKIRRVLVKQLVAEAFVPNREDEDDEVTFEDGDKRNCNSTNLRWAKLQPVNPWLEKEKAIYGIHLVTGHRVDFPSIKYAGLNSAFNSALISRCIKGKSKSHKNYKWYGNK